MLGQGHTRYDPQNMSDTCGFRCVAATSDRSKLHFCIVSFIANVLFRLCTNLPLKIIFSIKNDVFAVVYTGLLNMPVRETHSAVSN